MHIGEEELSELTSVPTKIADRRVLRGEAKFTVSFSPPFSDEDLDARDKTIRSLCPTVERAAKAEGYTDWVKDYYTIPFAWFVAPLAKTETNPIRHKETLEHRRSVGAKIFGKNFDACGPNSPCSTDAVVFPNSPYLKKERLFSALTGLDNIEDKKDAEDALYTLHETGHVLFPRSVEATSDKKVSFKAESLADGFGVFTFLELGGNAEAAQDFIDARDLSAFQNISRQDHWTADACRAVLKKEPMPSFDEAFAPIRELQIMAGVNLTLKDRALMNGPNPLLKSLSRVMAQKKKLSPKAFSKGLDILNAYARSCPSEAQETFRLTGFAEANPPFTLG